MGAKGANFHYEVFARMGFEAECEQIQALYLDGRKPEAIAAVPRALFEKVALIGPTAKIAEELGEWRRSLITSMLVSGDATSLRAIAELVL
jgi:hypothetical protein